MRKIPYVFIFLIFVGAILSYFFDTSSWLTQVDLSLSSPSVDHWMGTDALGRDMFSRVLVGARGSLIVGGLGCGFAFLIGTFLGLFFAYRGGYWEAIFMRAVEIFSAVPSMILSGVFILSMTVAFPFLKGSLFVFALILAITSWMNFSRLTRNLVLQEKQMIYVEASKALGASTPHILFKHILPNILPSLLVSAGMQFPHFLFFESFLSFVGLGVQAPHASWGSLLSDGWRSLSETPHLLFFPALFLFLFALSVNLIFEDLRKKLAFSNHRKSLQDVQQHSGKDDLDLV